MTKKDIIQSAKDGNCRRARAIDFIASWEGSGKSVKELDYVSFENKHWGTLVTYCTTDDPDWFQTFKMF